MFKLDYCNENIDIKIYKISSIKTTEKSVGYTKKRCLMSKVSQQFFY